MIRFAPRWRNACCALSLLAGCGAPAVPGGTEGVVHTGNIRLADIHVQLFDSNGEPVGFGVSQSDGALQLRQPHAAGPLWLPPGDYRVTVESVGPVALAFPADYTRADATPLMVRWSSTDTILDLDLPPPKPVR